MKKILFTLFAISFLSITYGQVLNPVTFDYSLVKKGKDVYDVHIKATIEPKWHIYSVNNPDGGAVATEIKIKDANTVGSIKENGKMKTVFEKEFKVNQKYFENSVDFVQTIKLKHGGKVAGTINYMVCNDRQCLPPKEVEFKIKM